MYLKYMKKLLDLPNLVSTVLITLLVSLGFVFAFGFQGFSVPTESLFTSSSDNSSSDDCGGACTVDGQAANCQGSNCTYDCNGINSPHKLPDKVETPNSTEEKRKVCSNDIYQSREYDADGNPLKDTDYHTPHQGSPTPHTHHWYQGERQPWNWVPPE